jgi:hypothetical protein
MLQRGMDRADPQTEALLEACRLLGGLKPLASRLKVQPDRLLTWLRAETAPPLEVVLGALDVIADAAYIA